MRRTRSPSRREGVERREDHSLVGCNTRSHTRDHFSALQQIPGRCDTGEQDEGEVGDTVPSFSKHQALGRGSNCATLATLPVIHSPCEATGVAATPAVCSFHRSHCDEVVGGLAGSILHKTTPSPVPPFRHVPADCLMLDEPGQLKVG